MTGQGSYFSNGLRCAVPGLVANILHSVILTVFREQSISPTQIMQADRAVNRVSPELWSEIFHVVVHDPTLKTRNHQAVPLTSVNKTWRVSNNMPCSDRCLCRSHRGFLSHSFIKSLHSSTMKHRFLRALSGSTPVWNTIRSSG